MLLSAALLLLWIPASDSAKPVATDAPNASNAVSEGSKPSITRTELPNAPIAKTDAAATSGDPSAPAFPPAAIKPAVDRRAPTPRQEKLWYTFMAAGHGAAAFDAWSTRRAISGNYGTESDPFMRPFSHSNAIYAATQVSPAVMDYLGRRMMTSSHPMLRRFWWVPQVAGAGFSFGSGMHNYNLVQ